MPSTISDYVGPARNDVSARASERSSRARAYFGQMRKLFIRPTMPEPIGQATKRTYRLWKENPRASALRFKKVRDV